MRLSADDSCRVEVPKNIELLVPSSCRVAVSERFSGGLLGSWGKVYRLG